MGEEMKGEANDKRVGRVEETEGAVKMSWECGT